MFEARLKAALIVLAILFAILVARLTQLQIVRADYYRDQAEKSLVQRTVSIPFSRGRILDRNGEWLVGEEPCWEIQVDFSMIAADVGNDSAAMSREVRRARRLGWFARTETEPVVAEALRTDFLAMWSRIADCAADPEIPNAEALRDRARGIYERVVRLRKAVAARRGFESPVAEEQAAHAVITNLDRARGMNAREALAAFPWVRVDAAAARAYAPDSVSFAHILGRLGPVDADDLADDLEADDPFARYVADDRRGITGVEWLAERQLRGRRGQVTLDRNGDALGDVLPAEPGVDVRLTILAPLQRQLYELLGESVRAVPESSGGSLVVLDVATREVLALVSYPGYDPAEYDRIYEQLADDTERLPLSFRAIANRYAPGSIVKPLVCMSGLVNGRTTLDTREECRGHLLADHPDKWRCWEMHGSDRRKAHGFVDVVEALRGSCNVYMYKLGERIGVDGLCSAFDMVGIGRPSGIGLREENFGINPTPDWLLNEKNSVVVPGHARNFAIGQGEVSVTPLQAANIAATYATGRFSRISILQHDEPQPQWTLPGTDAHWSAIRRGLFEVVNHADGTAHQYAWFRNERFALCGKTGSATAFPWPTAFRVPYVDADGRSGNKVIHAGAREPAVRRLLAEFPGATVDHEKVTVAGTWPGEVSKDDEYSHAWFAGYLQPLGGDGWPDWHKEPRVAFAVLIEFGGSGGRTSGPVAKAVAQVLLDTLGDDLEP